MALLLVVTPQATEAFATFTAIAIFLGILVILWLILPILVVVMNNKLGKIEKTLRETHHVIQRQSSILDELREAARFYVDSGQGKHEK